MRKYFYKKHYLLSIKKYCALLLPVVVLTLLVPLALAEDLDDFIKLQEQNIKKHKSSINDFILEANKNRLKHQSLAAEIIQDSKLNCKKHSNLDWWNELNLQEQQNPVLEAELYIFVSLSMPKLRLIALLKEAMQYRGVVVLRGLKNNNYKDTTNFLQPIIKETGYGFIINPNLFTEYNINKVPVFVLNNPATKKYDKVVGNIDLKYALQEIVKNGDLKKEAVQLLGAQK